MSRFTQPVTLTHRKGYDSDWIVTNSELTWEIGELGSGNAVRIPQGFATDLASVPRPLWPLIPPFGRHTNASILHDFLYRTRTPQGRRWADRQFYEAMLALDTPRLRARLMWLAVRVGGAAAWYLNRPAEFVDLEAASAAQ